VPEFGYKNHIDIDREFGFLRCYTITHAAAHDGGQLGAVLDRDNTARDVGRHCLPLGGEPGLARSPRAEATIPAEEAAGQEDAGAHCPGNATRAGVRSRIEHVFAAQKCRFGLLIRTIGLVRARIKTGLANLAYNSIRLVWLGGRAAPA
jgi:hypothetical protein